MYFQKINNFMTEPKQNYFTNMIEQVPIEIITNILKKLPISDLKSVSCVSRKFYYLSTDPLLWKNFLIKYDAPEELISILKLPRFKKLYGLELGNQPQQQFLKEYIQEGYGRNFLHLQRTPEAIYKKIFYQLESIKLQELHLMNVNLSHINKILLSRFLNKIKKVFILQNVILNDIQISKIIEYIPKGNMKCLHVMNKNFLHIHFNKLSSSINCLESFSVFSCNINKKQINALIYKMNMNNTKLKNLTICLPDRYLFKDIHPNILSCALNKLETLWLVANLNDNQLSNFFHIISENTNLHTLNLITTRTNTRIKISDYNLSKALNNLMHFSIRNLYFSANQIQKILEQIAMPTSKLLTLHLDYVTLPKLSLETLKAIHMKINNKKLKLNDEISDFINLNYLRELLKEINITY